MRGDNLESYMIKISLVPIIWRHEWKTGNLTMNSRTLERKKNVGRPRRKDIRSRCELIIKSREENILSENYL